MRLFTLPLYALCAVALCSCTDAQVQGAAKGAAIGGAVSAIFGGNRQDVVRGAAAGGVVGGLSN